MSICLAWALICGFWQSLPQTSMIAISVVTGITASGVGIQIERWLLRRDA